MSTNLVDEIAAEAAILPIEQQQQVLDNGEITGVSEERVTASERLRRLRTLRRARYQ